MKYCYSCFAKYGDEFNVCPHCGQVEITEPNEPIHLEPGTVLAGRYIVGASVGEGGFGIVYKAWDSKLEAIVAVKEFFISRIMTRAKGLKDVIVSKKAQEEFDFRKKRFLAEARNMAKFGTHRSIPNVFEFFEENHTAYIVMELLEGVTLSDYLLENKVNTEFAIYVANEVGKALKSLHAKNIIHRDVAPDNIFICSGKDLRIKLMDLGAAKLADNTDDAIDIILKPGYSPTEQYDNSKNIGPWTDLYALGATLYMMLTGEKPEESTNRKICDNVKPVRDLNPSVSENLSNTVMKAMAVEKHMRFKSVSEFLSAINGERKVVSLAKEKKQRKAKRISGMLIAGVLLAVIGVIVGSYFQKEKTDQTLRPANISVWFSIEEESQKEDNLNSVFKDFMEKNPGVVVEYRAIPVDEYENELKKAADNDTLPNLFESTDVDDSVLLEAIEIERVLQSEQSKECLFLDQYRNYYHDTKRIPLAIEIPIAYVITSGTTTIDYTDSFFDSLSDFGDANISLDTKRAYLYDDIFGKLELASEDEFFHTEGNTSPVLLSSTMTINRIRQLRFNYSIKYVFYNAESIKCRFTFEWSMGKGTQDEIRASETLLSWMLGTVYQTDLMSTKTVPEIPVNKVCLENKINAANELAPLNEIYHKFVFDKED